MKLRGETISQACPNLLVNWQKKKKERKRQEVTTKGDPLLYSDRLPFSATVSVDTRMTASANAKHHHNLVALFARALITITK